MCARILRLLGIAAISAISGYGQQAVAQSVSVGVGAYAGPRYYPPPRFGFYPLD